MEVLTKDEVLYHRGSLLTADGVMVASWDLEQQESFSGDYFSLAGYRGIRNAASAPFSVDYCNESVVHIINGMGVTLGDSIIGLTALEALREFNPNLHTIIYRPGRAPHYVDQLYHLAAGVVADLRWLPWKAEHIPEQELCIDAGNQLFWPAFTTLPMIDFFCRRWALNLPLFLLRRKPTAGCKNYVCRHYLNAGRISPTCCFAPPPVRRYAASRPVPMCHW